MHPRGESIAGVVHQADGLRVARDFLNADDRAEALFAHQLHRVIDAGEHRRLEPIAAARDAFAPALQRRALGRRVGHLRLERVELRRARDRADVGRLVHRVAELEAFDRLDKSLDELVVDALVHIDPLDRAAALAGVVHRAIG